MVFGGSPLGEPSAVVHVRHVVPMSDMKDCAGRDVEVLDVRLDSWNDTQTRRLPSITNREIKYKLGAM
jgi:hypothetical protein